MLACRTAPARAGHAIARNRPATAYCHTFIRNPPPPLVGRVLIDAERPAPGGVTLRVLPPMPRLEVSVSGLPPTVLAGEVVRGSLRLRNSGAMSLQRLSMAAAAGTGVFLQPPSGQASSGAADAADGPASAGSSSGSGSAPELVASFRQGAAIFSLPAARLGVGQELVLPVWFRWGGCGAAQG